MIEKANPDCEYFHIAAVTDFGAEQTDSRFAILMVRSSASSSRSDREGRFGTNAGRDGSPFRQRIDAGNSQDCQMPGTKSVEGRRLGMGGDRALIDWFRGCVSPMYCLSLLSLCFHRSRCNNLFFGIFERLFALLQ